MASRWPPSGFFRRLRRGLKARLPPWLAGREGYQFRPAPSIRSQRFSFAFGGRELSVEAGYDTPLYETIAEVVDFDCYRLRDLDAPALAGTTVVDIGANIGVTSLCLSQLCDWGRHVCFEPAPANRAWLLANLRRNGMGGVEVRSAAVAATSGRAQFWVSDHDSVGARLADGAAVTARSIEVQTASLEEALDGLGTIGVMKVDCEGGEYSIVEQLDPLVPRIRNITMEVHDRGDTFNLSWLSERLQRLGYGIRLKPDPFGRDALHHVLASR